MNVVCYKFCLALLELLFIKNGSICFSPANTVSLFLKQENGGRIGKLWIGRQNSRCPSYYPRAFRGKSGGIVIPPVRPSGDMRWRWRGDIRRRAIDIFKAVMCLSCNKNWSKSHIRAPAPSHISAHIKVPNAFLHPSSIGLLPVTVSRF